MMGYLGEKIPFFYRCDGYAGCKGKVDGDLEGRGHVSMRFLLVLCIVQLRFTPEDLLFMTSTLDTTATLPYLSRTLHMCPALEH